MKSEKNVEKKFKIACRSQNQNKNKRNRLSKNEENINDRTNHAPTTKLKTLKIEQNENEKIDFPTIN